MDVTRTGCSIPIRRCGGRRCATSPTRSGDEVAAARAQVATQGWGARLLAARDAGRPVGGRRLLPGGLPRRLLRRPAVDLDAAQSRVAARVRRRPRRRRGPRRRSRRSPRTAAGSTTGQLVLRGRGRAVHQRPHGRDRRLLRRRRRRPSSRGCSVSSSPTAAGTARPRTGRCARRSTRRSACSKGLLEYERARRRARRGRGAAPRRGVPARTAAVPAAEHRRGRRSGAGCSSRSRRSGTTTCCAASTTSVPPVTRRTSALAEALDARPGQAQPGRHLAAREHPPRRGALPARGRRRPAQPVEHAARAAGARLGRRSAVAVLSPGAVRRERRVPERRAQPAARRADRPRRRAARGIRSRCAPARRCGRRNRFELWTSPRTTSTPLGVTPLGHRHRHEPRVR